MRAGEYRRRIRPEGGRTGAAFFKFKGPQGGLFPEAPSGSKSTRKRVRRTLGVATPHKGEHTKGETGSESWWTSSVVPALPPWVVSFGVFPFLGTGGATW